MRTLVIAIVLWSATAFAQPSATESVDRPIDRPAPRSTVIGHKDATHATLLSIAGTVGGVGLLYFASKFGDQEGDVMKVFAAGFMVMSPAWGTWWDRDQAAFTAGMGLRLAGFAIGGAGIGTDHSCNALARMTGGGSPSPCTGSSTQTASDSMLGLGLALGVAGTVLDIVEAGREARARRLVVLPAVTPTSAGISAALSF